MVQMSCFLMFSHLLNSHFANKNTSAVETLSIAFSDHLPSFFRHKKRQKQFEVNLLCYGYYAYNHLLS